MNIFQPAARGVTTVAALLAASLAPVGGGGPARAAGGANGLPNCADPRHVFETTYLDASRDPKTRPLCVCAPASSGCGSVTLQQCQDKLYKGVVNAGAGKRICVYSLGQLDHPAPNGGPPAYWGQWIRPDSYTKSCADIAAMGFTISTVTVTHNTAVPRPHSYQTSETWFPGHTLRDYAQPGLNALFLDSFPLNPQPDSRNVCELSVTVTGQAGALVGANDAVQFLFPTIANAPMRPNPPATPKPNSVWQNAVMAGQQAVTTPNAAFSATRVFSVATGTGASAAGQVRTMDVVVFDDLAVNPITVTYKLY